MCLLFKGVTFSLALKQTKILLGTPMNYSHLAIGNYRPKFMDMLWYSQSETKPDKPKAN